METLNKHLESQRPPKQQSLLPFDQAMVSSLKINTGIEPDSKRVTSASEMTKREDSQYFPISIRQVPGRGRGFFATRNIAQGETVLKAAPLAWTISEAWIKNVCLWCFECNYRRSYPIKARDVLMEAINSARVPDSANGSATQSHFQKDKRAGTQSVHHKGVFCSEDCRQRAVHAHGGQAKWECFVALFDSIYNETRTQKRHQTNARPTAKTSKSENSQPAIEISTAASVFGSTAEEQLSAGLFLDSEFDPDDISDEQLGKWIDMVWDMITESQMCFNVLLDSYHQDIVYLVANGLCLRSTTPILPVPDIEDPDCVVSRKFGDGDVAREEFLENIKTNETESLRAWLHQLYTESPPASGPASVPATIAPIRIPWKPTLLQIAHSRWGQAFGTAAASYALLKRAWKSTARTHQLNELTHIQFRAVYYREKANSFGIWDPPPTYPTWPLQLGDNQERECVGFAIYPTAVYFNHSCAPNISKARSGRTMSFVTNRAICRDEELFISYGSVTDPASERRSRLSEYFFFDCACDRCIEETVITVSASASASAPAASTTAKLRGEL
ncbi:hypothetical protein GGF37_004089 [Kickxella alabastrina]|nr:hypothetical protein GGF37_004089 [Kickxella alabastrina]